MSRYDHHAKHNNENESDDAMKKFNRSEAKKEDAMSAVWFCARSDNTQDVAHGDFGCRLDYRNFS